MHVHTCTCTIVHITCTHVHVQYIVHITLHVHTCTCNITCIHMYMYISYSSVQVDGINIWKYGPQRVSGHFTFILQLNIIFNFPVDSDLKEESDGEPKRRKLMDDAKPNSRVRCTF